MQAESTSEKKRDSERQPDPFSADWHCMKPDMPTPWKLDDEWSYKHFSIWWEQNSYLLSHEMNKDMGYCVGCETFFSTQGGALVPLEKHPSDSVVNAGDMLWEYGITDKDSFFSWMVGTLSYDLSSPCKEELVSYRLPGINRYHFTYSWLTGQEYLQKTLEEKTPREQIEADLRMAIRDKMIERVEVDLRNALIQLGRTSPLNI